MAETLDTFTADDKRVIEAFHKAIETRGRDYVYKAEEGTGSCFYRQPVFDEWGDVDHTEGEPGCVFGLAFDLLGILPDELHPSSVDDGKCGIEGTSAEEAARRLGLDLSVPVSRAMVHAQGSQDSGDAWGVVEQVFEQYLK